MKKFTPVLLLILFSIITFKVSAQSNDAKKNLIQKWQMSLSKADQDTMNAQAGRMNVLLKALDDSIAACGKDTTKANMFASQKEMYKAMMPSADMMDMSKNTIEFNPDGTFEMIMLEQEMNGKWKIIENDKRLVVMETGRDRNDTVLFVQLTDKIMTLAHDVNDTHPMSFISWQGNSSPDKNSDANTKGKKD